jgi:AmmeMemoRadiSam system radical SAM enzyme/AmmeMemoRadiSam system protein B/AmmeMemoRadiSam system protein A
MRSMLTPPESFPTASGAIAGGWWHDAPGGGRIVCDLCPRECQLKPGDRGFCFVRQNTDGRMELTTYGRSTGFSIDPIEKKPLNHFYPGTSVLSFGTAGCNLGCKFCQNWDISKSREVERLSELAMPDVIAAAAKETGCRSVAFTYNDPVIWAEYAIDTAKACRSAGIKSVAVTAGYITPAARPAFFHAMDAANVDLKAFTEDFYQHLTYSHLEPVLDTLRWLKHESDVWFEITNLVIPGANDSDEEFRRMCDWILNSIGADVPIHFTAFHPDFRMQDRGPTPHETLLRGKEIAIAAGIRYAYVGNVHDVPNQSTWCSTCHELLIERDWHQLGTYRMQGNRCGKCGAQIPGQFDATPGTWGRRRQPIRIRDYATHRSSAAGTQPSIGTLVPLTIPPRDRILSETMQPVQAIPQLTKSQESSIHRAACEIVMAAVHQRPVHLTDATLQNCAEITVMGVFVTLKREGQLRGCCGTLGQPMNLLSALRQAALRTATDDHRFPSVSASELPYLSLDVTLLAGFETITAQGDARIDAVAVGTHGLRIQYGDKSGLLLPSVATEHAWDARTFLEQVCRKAQLPLNAWKNADSQLTRFAGHMIAGHFDAGVLTEIASQQGLFVSQSDIKKLAGFAGNNIISLRQGAVPGCFPPECADGTVDGVCLQLTFHDSSIAPTFSCIQLRGGLPLQMTLLKLTEAAATWLRQSDNSRGTKGPMQADLLVLANPNLHGTLERPDLRGIDSARRTVMVSEGQRTAWIFHAENSAPELVAHAAAAAKISTPAVASIVSFESRCSTQTMEDTNVPLAQQGPSVRPPARAGQFYPGTPELLAAAVSECLGALPAEKQPWSAVMVPHAGLKFSGRIAADVLKQVEIPDTVIIIGPRHTRQGVEWAVAPHQSWQIPGANIDSNLELAQQLVARIEGLEFDSAAHANEHSIEVELPLLARLAPATRVVGITIGGGSFEQCRRFGQDLALLLSEQETQPLLIISSDMNHFATDEENRRLDERALQAMETMDPAKLYDIVRAESISMCGVLPAVIVMEALLCLDRLSEVKRISYATSADVTGDKQRVVGYAGVLLGG